MGYRIYHIQKQRKSIMNISREGIEVTNRFFEALAMLSAQKRMKGMKEFTDRYGINRWNLYTLKAEPSSHVLKPECIVYLIRDYGISAEWLLLGRGGMFTYNI